MHAWERCCWHACMPACRLDSSATGWRHHHHRPHPPPSSPGCTHIECQPGAPHPRWTATAAAPQPPSRSPMAAEGPSRPRCRPVPGSWQWCPARPASCLVLALAVGLPAAAERVATPVRARGAAAAAPRAGEPPAQQAAALQLVQPPAQPAAERWRPVAAAQSRVVAAGVATALRRCRLAAARQT